MQYIFIIMCLLILAVWLFFGAREFCSAKKRTGKQRILTLLASTLITIGALGFFGSALSAMGGLNWLPHSFEWPVGRATGVVSTKDGYWVVPHTPTGRIQIYDSHWKFLRGWNVDASAGTFKLYITDTNQIHVVTARGQRLYVYDIHGELLSKAGYPATGTGYSAFPDEGATFVVPTPIWLWIFSSPIYSWAAAAAGIACLIARDKLTKGKQRETATPS